MYLIYPIGYSLIRIKMYRYRGIFSEKLSKYSYRDIGVSLIALAMYRRDNTVASFRLLSVCPVDSGVDGGANKGLV